MKARMLTIVWGAQHLDWFERACVASLALPLNAAALRENITAWDIVTRPEDVEAVMRIAEPLGVPIVLHSEHVLAGPAPEILQREIMEEMALCVADDAALFMAPPDSVFGEGSVPAIFEIGTPRGICVAVPHVRVLPPLLDDIGVARSNASLVAASWRHLHRTWIEAEAHRELTNTWAGGVSWREAGPGLYAVTHRLPTVYLAKFDQSDIDWWNGWQAKQNLQGAWDHFWPSKLVAEMRLRVVGSSDAAFIAEVTPEFANIPPCSPNDPGEPDKCWGQGAHFVVNRYFVAIFRAEPQLMEAAE